MSYEIKAPKVAETFVNFIERRSLLAIFFGLLILILSLPGFLFLTVDFSYKGFFYDDDPMIKDFNSFEKQFGNDDSIVMAIHSPSGVFDKESLQLVQKLTEKAWLLPEVIRVDSLSNYNWVHAEGDDILIEPLIADGEDFNESYIKDRKKIALNHEVLPNYLISKDAKTTLIFARLKPGLKEAAKFKKTVVAAKKLIKEYSLGDHQLHLSGGPTITYGFEEATQIDLSKMIPILLLSIIVLLYINLKTVWGVVLPFVVIILTTAATFAVGAFFGVQITSATAAVPQILIGISIADSVHLLAVFYRAVQDGVEQKEAARYSLLKNFVPTGLTTISTAIGFFSFSNVNIKSISGMGTLAGIGVLLAWAFSYLVLGGLMYRLPAKLPKWTDEKRGNFIQSIQIYVDFLKTIKKPLTIGCLLLSGYSIFLSLKNHVNSDPYLYFKKGYWLRESQDFITKNVGASRGIEVVIRTGKAEGIKEPEFLKKVEVFQNWVEGLPHVTRALSIIDILKSTNRVLHGGKQSEYRLVEDRKMIAEELLLYTQSIPQGMSLNDRMTINKDSLRMSVLSTLSASSEFEAAVKKIEAKARDLGLDVMTTGKSKLYQFLNGYVVESFVQSISVALVCISLLLIIYFKSLSVGVLALITNTIPLMIGGAVLYLSGRAMDVGTVIVASVCLGIAVDDTIHVLSNYKRQRLEGKSRNQSVVNVLAYTTPALIITTIILVVSFGTLAFGIFVPNVYFGIMCAVILSIALIVDLTFLPAVLISLKDKD